MQLIMFRDYQQCTMKKLLDVQDSMLMVAKSNLIATDNTHLSSNTTSHIHEFPVNSFDSLLGIGLGLVGDTDIMSFMSPRYFLTYSFQWRIPLVILRYMAHLDSSNKLFFILKKTIEKTALVTQNHHF